MDRRLFLDSACPSDCNALCVFVSPYLCVTDVLVLFVCLSRYEFKVILLRKSCYLGSNLYYSYEVIARLASVTNPTRVLAVAVLNL